MITTEVMNKFMRFLASKAPPLMRLLPTDRYGTWIPKDRKQTLPKVLSYRQLRNLSRDPVVRKAIQVAQDYIVSLPYSIDVIGGRGKYTKQIATITNVIEHPNLVHDRRTFMNIILDDAIVLDNMAVEMDKSRDASHPIYLYPVDGSTIQNVLPIDYCDPNAVRYAQIQQQGMQYFTANDLAVFHRSSFSYDSYGLSLVQECFKYLQYYIDNCEMSNDMSTNRTSEFLISLGENVKPEEREQFEQYLRNDIEGTGRLPVVAGSKNVSSTQIRAINRDNLGIPWIDRLTNIVAMTFGVSPESLGITVANDRNTLEDQENTMLNHLIKPYAGLIEDLYNRYVIKPMGLEGILKFRFVYEATEQQKTVKSKRILDEYYRGAITENEFRAMMGYDASTSQYANMTYPEKTATINVDLGIAGGFNSNGITKDTSELPTTGGDNNG